MQTAQLKQKVNRTKKIHKLIDFWLELGESYSKEISDQEKIIERRVCYLLGKERNLFQLASYWVRVPPKSQLEEWFETKAKAIINSFTDDILFKECSHIEEEFKVKDISLFLKEIKQQKEEGVVQSL